MGRENRQKIRGNILIVILSTLHCPSNKVLVFSSTARKKSHLITKELSMLRRLFRTHQQYSRLFSTGNPTNKEAFNVNRFDHKNTELLLQIKHLQEQFNVAQRNLKRIQNRSEPIYKNFNEVHVHHKIPHFIPDFTNQIKKFENFILTAMKTSILQGLHTTEYGPVNDDDRNDSAVLMFFMPAFKAYGIKFDMSIKIVGSREYEDYLQFTVPQSITCIDNLSMEENAAYGAWINYFIKNEASYREWIQSFVNRINLTIKSTEEMVEEHYITLILQLYLPISNGAANSVTKLEACYPAAIDRFKKFADDNDIKVCTNGDVFTAEKIENRPSYQPR